MRRLFVYCLVVVCLLAIGDTVYAKNGLVKIADGVYAYVDEKEPSPANSYGANVGVIVGKEGVVVVDTLISSKESKRLISDIRAVTDKPIKYVVNTHYHIDHTFGNSEFDRLGATIIAQKSNKAAMKKSAESALKNAEYYGLTEEDMEGTEIAYPAITFKEGMEIDLGDLTVETLYVTHSHTAGSVLVYLPERKALFTGDILFTDFHPYMADGNLDGWIRTLDYIMTMDVEKIIPGHGPVSGKSDVQDMKEYLVAFDKNARKLTTESGNIEFIIEEIKRSLPSRSRGGFLIKANIQMGYLKRDDN